MSAPGSTAGRLRWRCRRGIKELDLLLERYLSVGWPVAAAGERAAFASLLELSDPELAALCLGGARTPDPARAALVRVITTARPGDAAA